MTGYEFEYFVASYLQSNGYYNLQVTQASNDFGIDITATKNGIKYAIQCKYYSNPVGNSAVQEAVAGMAYYDCQKAMVVTNSTFTVPAKKLAAVNDVILLENVSPETTHFTKHSFLLKSSILSVPLWILSVISFAASMNLLFRGEIGPCLVGLCFGMPYPIIKLRNLLISKKSLLKIQDKTINCATANYIKNPCADTYEQDQTELDDYYLKELIKSYFYTISDDLLLESIYCVISNQRTSISMLQRHLKIGFNSAASLMDNLYELGVVGPDLGSKPKKVLITINDLKYRFDKTFSDVYQQNYSGTASTTYIPQEYKSALAKAKTYSDTIHMSKAGLYKHLTSEHGKVFSAEAAQYAVDHVQADWNRNALEKAKIYKKNMNMSPDAIWNQLVSEHGEQFTKEEANYAIEKLRVI